MFDWMQEEVQAFHEKFRRPVGRWMGDYFGDEKMRRLRAALVLEEACEFVAACGFDPLEMIHGMPNVLADQRGVGSSHVWAKATPNFPEAIDALVDILYVTLGSAVTFGVLLRGPFNLVHQANMAKVGGGESDLGKILKPPDWKPPDIVGWLRLHGWKGDR
jgi:predicted HAD superfamily Cof-like phosphohydrolase